MCFIVWWGGSSGLQVFLGGGVGVGGGCGALNISLLFSRLGPGAAAVRQRQCHTCVCCVLAYESCVSAYESAADHVPRSGGV